jgi:peptidoglycan/xylan/chitin deacetylase (PgdA/CDA1 family)
MIYLIYIEFSRGDKRMITISEKPRKFFTMSFDDGTVQDVRFVELINKYKLKCTFNLNSGFFGRVHGGVHEGIEIDHSEITADMVADLYKGHEVAVHTVHHPNLLKLSREEIIKEVSEDKKALEELCGYEITGMAYPGGPFYNDFVIDTILENTGIYYARDIDCHFTFKMPERLMTWHPTCHQNDKEILKLAESFIKAEAKEDMLFYVWGHSFEFDKFEDSWDNFEKFCKLISGKADIQYVTNGEIAAYISDSVN